MENKKHINPLVSGGILVDDQDYFKKDEVNMENNSLKASLALLTKIKNQKKGEINSALQNTYLKEENITPNNSYAFDEPKINTNAQNNQADYITTNPSNTYTQSEFSAPQAESNAQNNVASTQVSQPTTPLYTTQNTVNPKYESQNNFGQDTNQNNGQTYSENNFGFDAQNDANNASTQGAGITVADLDDENQNSLVEKDEYIPEYRKLIDEYLNQSGDTAQPTQSQFDYQGYQNQESTQNQGAPLYNVNQTAPIEYDNNQYMGENTIDEPQGEPQYIVNEKDKKGKRGKKEKLAPTCTKEEIKEGKGVAWLAYIVFFLPLLFKKNNPFVRWHANEGLELFFMDILGVGFFCIGWFLKSNNAYITALYLVSLTVGAILIILSIFTRIMMIFFTLAGKEAQHPWFFKKFRFIK